MTSSAAGSLADCRVRHRAEASQASQASVGRRHAVGAARRPPPPPPTKHPQGPPAPMTLWSPACSPHHRGSEQVALCTLTATHWYAPSISFCYLRWSSQGVWVCVFFLAHVTWRPCHCPLQSNVMKQSIKKKKGVRPEAAPPQENPADEGGAQVANPFPCPSPRPMSLSIS